LTTEKLVADVEKIWTTAADAEYDHATSSSTVDTHILTLQQITCFIINRPTDAHRVPANKMVLSHYKNRYLKQVDSAVKIVALSQVRQ